MPESQENVNRAFRSSCGQVEVGRGLGTAGGGGLLSEVMEMREKCVFALFQWLRISFHLCRLGERERQRGEPGPAGLLLQEGNPQAFSPGKIEEGLSYQRTVWSRVGRLDLGEDKRPFH